MYNDVIHHARTHTHTHTHTIKLLLLLLILTFLLEVPFVTSSSSSSSFSSRTFDHLWKFLLHLLLSPNHGHVIQWTGQGYEFCITDHSTLARMWAEASRSDSAPLTYHGLIGELRSYSGLGILESISEDELKYQFKLDIQAYLSMYMDSISQQQ